MVSSVLLSTFLLTLLLSAGLFFFIKASVKDRTQTVKLVSEQAGDSISSQLEQYFAQRSYRPRVVDAERNQIALEGFVRPSLFLAVFLTALAAVGILCLSLVLSILFPRFSVIWLALILLAPLAGAFYWQKAGRPEKVLLQVENVTNASPNECSVVTVTAHRDEVAELRRTFPLKLAE